MLDTLAASPALSVLGEGERTALLKAHAKLKKDALALAVEQALDYAGWLPEVLKLPEGAHFEITNAGLAPWKRRLEQMRTGSASPGSVR